MILERLEKLDKSIETVDSCNRAEHRVISGKVENKMLQDDQQDADYKKQKLASKWALWTTIGASLITGIVAIILALTAGA